MRFVKRLSIFLVVVACGVAAFSYVYNFPIRFWKVAPHSISVLHEAESRPDNIVLTPTNDMRTRVSITWRTSNSVSDGFVQYSKVSGNNGDQASTERQADQKILYSRELTSNNTVHCHTVTLGGLEPGATYRYRVGSKERNAWSDYRSFTTAPVDPDSFSFVYFGDTQAHPDRFAKMLLEVEQRHPETAFYMIGGDLVEAGYLRNLWDDLLAYTDTVFSVKPIVPAMGNHDLNGKVGSGTFSTYFNLPFTEIVGGSSELNYSFQYGKAFFIVINARRDLDKQAAWLEAELQKAEAAGSQFKVVMCHFPAYNPKQGRKNTKAQEYWVPLFDKYGVDLMLSGHDHSYLRSMPLKAGSPASPGQTGTTYVVATGCEKFYDFQTLPVAAKQFTGITTYQLITIKFDSEGLPKMLFTAHSPSGEILDAFEPPISNSVISASRKQ